MTLYMSQFSYTPEAWTTLTQNPQDRSQVLGELMEGMGGRLIALYYSFGEYDGVILYEAPDESTAAAIVLAAISPGHVRTIKTTTLLTAEETTEVLRKAGAATYRGPRG